MADRQAIENTLASWALGYDEGDVPRMANCFTQDATMVMDIGLPGADQERMGPYVGHAEVMGLFTSHQGEQQDQRRHVTTNVVVDDETDTSASTTSYLVLTVVESNVLRLQATGVYRDKFVLDEGTWRIRERHLQLDVHY